MELKFTISQLALMKVMFGCTPREDPEAWHILFNTVNLALTDWNKRREAMINEYVTKEKDKEWNDIMTVPTSKIEEFEEKMANFHVILSLPEDKFEAIRKVWNEFPTRYVHPKTWMAGILWENDLAAYTEIKNIFNPVTEVKYD